MMRTQNKASAVMRTDLTRWRLASTEGNHRWLYLCKAEAEKQPQSFAERYFLGLPTVSLVLEDR